MGTGDAGAATRRDRQTSSTARARRPLLKSFRLWVPVAIVVVLLAGTALVGKDLMDRASVARDALQEAIPLASVAKQQILDGDSEGARATAAQLGALTATARQQTEGGLWSTAEVVPVIGSNLSAVRTVAEVVDDLVTNAVTPAAELSIASLAPSDGRIDTAALGTAAEIVDQAADAVSRARAALDELNRTGLMDEVAGGVDRLDGAIAELEPLVVPAQRTLAVLPGILGADAPRNYLVMVQNNAESRGTGGNPAALVVIHVDDGAVSIGQQASSTDFEYGRQTPVIPLDPQTVALYGDRVGRYMMDVTMTPDFSESARIMGAFWAESFDTPIDATVSIDPVALSYLLAATGPVTLENGDVLTADDAVQTLLNQVYFDLPDPEMQDAYFATAAGGVFDALTSVTDVKALAEQVTRAVDEGRILYAPTAELEAEYIAGSRLSGRLPTDNADRTMLGVYVNDTTEGKLDYYMDLAVSVGTDVCQNTSAPSFAVTSTLTNTLRRDEVWDLAQYISPARFFPRGVVSTDLVIYGPVGAEFSLANVDGVAVEGEVVEHLGRPAVKINVENEPGSSHTVDVVFTGAEGEYAPVELWHTPMVRETEVAIDAPDCVVP